MSDTENLLKHSHRLLAGVSGSIALAISSKKLTKTKVEEWLTGIAGAADILREFINPVSGEAEGAVEKKKAPAKKAKKK